LSCVLNCALLDFSYQILVKWVWNVTSVLMISCHMSILWSQRQMPPHFNDLQEWLVTSGFINGGLEMVRNCEI